MILTTWKKYDAVATFFINGNNKSKGKINDPKTPWPAVIKVFSVDPELLESNTY